MSTMPPAMHLKMGDGSTACRGQSGKTHQASTDPRVTTCKFCRTTGAFIISIKCENARDHYRSMVDENNVPIPGFSIDDVRAAWEAFNDARATIIGYNGLTR